MHHWTDHNIRVHVFTCVLALQIAHLLRRHTDQHALHVSVRELLDTLYRGDRADLPLHRRPPQGPPHAHRDQPAKPNSSTSSTSIAGRHAVRSHISEARARGMRKAQPRELTIEERRRLLGWLDGTSDEPKVARKQKVARATDLPDLIRFALGTGLRVGEVCGVRICDRDLDGVPVVSDDDIRLVPIVEVRSKVCCIKARAWCAATPARPFALRIIPLPGFVTGRLRARLTGEEHPMWPLFAAGRRRRPPDIPGGRRRCYGEFVAVSGRRRYESCLREPCHGGMLGPTYQCRATRPGRPLQEQRVGRPTGCVSDVA
ncbi:MAG: hypothetical protein ACRDST_00870 [Pseudonocardiaceae bacterium]